MTLQETPRERAKNFNSIKNISPRNQVQEKLLRSIDENIVTIALGPAGTGKTYLAVYQALCQMWAKKTTGIKRIILTRPVVEAGESLGFLPGELEDKMDPYMRPFFDALCDIVGPEIYREKIERGYIEIAPLAFMRGRTFNNCVILLDEAQNCTYSQLKMVLTRLGDNTKLIISGDSTQSDLRGESGLERIAKVIQNVESVGTVRFDASNVVRSKIVKDLLRAIEDNE